MEFIRYINSDNNVGAQILFLHIGEEFTSMAMYLPELEEIKPLCFDESEREYRIANAVFIDEKKHCVIGSHAFQMYHNELRGVFYRNFARDMQKLDETATAHGNNLSRNNQSIGRMTNRDLLGLFVEGIVKRLRTPNLSRICGLRDGGALRIFLSVGSPFAAHGKNILPNSLLRSEEYGDTEFITVDPLVCLSTPHTYNDYIGAFGDRIIRYSKVSNSFTNIGNLPAPNYLVESFIKALFYKKYRRMPKSAELIGTDDPVTDILSRLDDTELNPKCVRSKILVRVDGEEDETMIRLSDTDKEFFLERMPFFFAKKTYYGAKRATIAIVARAINDIKCTGDIWFADPVYRTIWGEDVSELSKWCKIVFLDSAEMFSSMRARYLYEEQFVGRLWNSFYSVGELLRRKLNIPSCKELFDSAINDIKNTAITSTVYEWTISARDRSLADCDKLVRSSVVSYIDRALEKGGKLRQPFEEYPNLSVWVRKADECFYETLMNSVGRAPASFVHDVTRYRSVYNRYFGINWNQPFYDIPSIQNGLSLAKGFFDFSNDFYPIPSNKRLTTGNNFIGRIDYYSADWVKEYRRCSAEKIDRTTIEPFINDLINELVNSYRRNIEELLKTV